MKKLKYTEVFSNSFTSISIEIFYQTEMEKFNKQRRDQMTLQEHQHLMRKLNQEYHKEMKPRLLGEQWRER